ncbi:hypothetical protein INR49_027089 [Caranx melampygus]|nr:hypothetical protein INR49_027089 [Caranx melampygus]
MILNLAQINSVTVPKFVREGSITTERNVNYTNYNMLGLCLDLQLIDGTGGFSAIFHEIWAGLVDLCAASEDTNLTYNDQAGSAHHSYQLKGSNEEEGRMLSAPSNVEEVAADLGPHLFR